VVRLVDHVGDVPRGGGNLLIRLVLGGHQLVEDEEELERVRRSDYQIVVGVLARVEVESPQPRPIEKLGDDLLDVHALRMVTGVNEHLRLRTKVVAYRVSGAPVRQVGAVEPRLEKLVLDQQADSGWELRVDQFQRLAQTSG